MLMYLGIGLPKTGTTSLTAAFKLLGYTAGHGVIRPQSYYRGQSRDMAHFVKARFLPAYRKYEFVCDVPASIDYPEMDKAFPGMRFIYTWRELDDWLGSCERHFRCKTKSWYRWKLFGCLKFDQELFTRAWYAHRAAAEHYFSQRPNDVLYLNICSGADPWEDLCAFLQRAEPQQPFPHEGRRR